MTSPESTLFPKPAGVFRVEAAMNPDLVDVGPRTNDLPDRCTLTVGHWTDRIAPGMSNSDVRTRIVRELYLAHHGQIVSFLRRLTTADQAEDYAQEVFFRLFQVKNLETREIGVSYLFRIGENLVRKAYRKDLRRRKADHELRNRSIIRDDVDQDGSALGESHRGTEIKAVTHTMLQRALECLTDREEAAVRLIVCRGLSYEEAASALGVNVTTINNWKHRGVKKLRTFLNGELSSVGRLESDRRSKSGRLGGGDGGQGPDSRSNPGGRGSNRSPSQPGERYDGELRLRRA